MAFADRAALWSAYREWAFLDVPPDEQSIQDIVTRREVDREAGSGAGLLRLVTVDRNHVTMRCRLCGIGGLPSAPTPASAWVTG